MTRIALPADYAHQTIEQSYIFEAWQPADSTWIYSSPAVRDATNTWNGNATLSIPYHATPNQSKADWKPLTSGPTCSDIMQFWFRNSTDHALAVDILIDTTGTFGSFSTCSFQLPPTGGNWKKMIFNPIGHQNPSALYNTNPPSKGGTFKQVQQMRFRQSTVITPNGWASGDSVNIGGLSFQTTPQRPKAILTFDDAKDSVGNNYSWLTDRELLGVVPAYASAVGNSGYATWAQLDAMYAAGFDICNHSNNEFFGFVSTHTPTVSNAQYSGGYLVLTLATPHVLQVGQYVNISGLSPSGYNGNKPIAAVGANTLSFSSSDLGSPTGTATVILNFSGYGMCCFSATEVEDSIKACDTALAARGYSAARRQHYVHPQGWWHDAVHTALVNTGMLTARGTQPDNVSVFDRDAYHHWPQDPEAATVENVWDYLGDDSLTMRERDGVLYYGGTIDVEASQTLSNIYQRIDDAIKYKRMCVTLTHALGTGDSAHHQAWLDYLVTKRDQGLIDIVTVSEWYAGLTGARVNTSGRIAS